MHYRSPPRGSWQRSWQQGLRQARATRALHVLVGLLLLIPVLLVGHWLDANGTTLPGPDRWYVDRDRSYMEILGYLVVFGAAALLLVLSVRRRIPVYAGWAGALLVVVGDDALEWHERGGELLDARLGLPAVAGLRGQDLGELVVWGGLGVMVLILLVLTHRRSGAAARRDSVRLGALILLLMVFAVGVDMVHAALGVLTSSSRLDLLVLWAEASGEVGAMAAIFAYVVHLARRSPAHEDGARGPVRATRGLSRSGAS